MNNIMDEITFQLYSVILNFIISYLSFCNMYMYHDVSYTKLFFNKSSLLKVLENIPKRLILDVRIEMNCIL